MRTFLIVLVAIAVASIGLPDSAEARIAPAPIAASEAVAARAHADQVSLDQAVARVQARYKARVMRANTIEEGGRVVHYIRLMDPETSRVWTVRVDASTGREF